MKRTVKKFAEELKNEAKANGWDRTRVLEEIARTVDLTEWFVLSAAERRAVLNDEAAWDALAGRLADIILAA